MRGTRNKFGCRTGRGKYLSGTYKTTIGFCFRIVEGPYARLSQRRPRGVRVHPTRGQLPGTKLQIELLHKYMDWGNPSQPKIAYCYEIWKMENDCETRSTQNDIDTSFSRVSSLVHCLESPSGVAYDKVVVATAYGYLVSNYAS